MDDSADGSQGPQPGDTASSKNTAMSNPVLQLFGHAKARLIASDPALVKRTNNEGKRWLTQQSRETKTGSQGRNSALQFGWIKYRLIGLQEVQPLILKHCLTVSQAQLRDVRELLEGQNLVHAVVTNLHDESWVVTTYFVNGAQADFKEVVQSTLFDFLEDDDPDVIVDATRDPIFLEALRAEFECGDTKDSRLWKTLSKWKAPLSLLHHCCERNYHACVRLLLSDYTPQVAKEPWLCLAEPDLWADKFRNTAYHSAAYCASAECLEHLVHFAQQHGLDITTLLDKSEKTALDIAEARGHHRCYNILAPAFGLPLKATELGDAQRSKQEAVAILDYVPTGQGVPEDSQCCGVIGSADLLSAIAFENGSYRFQKDVETRQLSPDQSVGRLLHGSELVRLEAPDGAALWDISQSPEALKQRLDTWNHPDVRAVGALRVRHFLPSEGPVDGMVRAAQRLLDMLPAGATPDKFQLVGYKMQLQDHDRDQQDLAKLFELLHGCRGVSFRKCVCESPKITLFVCRAVRQCLESGSTQWIQLFVFPSCTSSTEQTPELLDELPLLVKALRTSSVCHISRSGCKTCGVPAGPVPMEGKYWIGVVGTCLDVNRFLSSWRSKRAEQGSSSSGAVVKERGDGVPAVFMHGVLRMWRFMLNYSQLFDRDIQSIDAAFDPNAPKFVEEWLHNMSACWLKDLSPDEADEILPHLDFALWALLRMHRLLPTAPALVLQVVPAQVLAKLSKTREYVQRKGWE